MENSEQIEQLNSRIEALERSLAEIQTVFGQLMHHFDLRFSQATPQQRRGELGQGIMVSANNTDFV